MQLWKKIIQKRGQHLNLKNAPLLLEDLLENASVCVFEWMNTSSKRWKNLFYFLHNYSQLSFCTLQSHFLHIFHLIAVVKGVVWESFKDVTTAVLPSLEIPSQQSPNHVLTTPRSRMLLRRHSSLRWSDTEGSSRGFISM